MNQQSTSEGAARALAHFKTNTGQTLASISRKHPLLLVFLRHSGCTFCREALSDLQAKREKIEADGVRICLVHMTTDERAAEFFGKYGLDDVPRVADPERGLYEAMGLKRGRPSQLFGAKVWMRGAQAALQGHGIGMLEGNGLQMPGVFLVHNGDVVAAFRHESAADRPDYEQLACEFQGA